MISDDLIELCKPKRSKHLCLPQALIATLQSDPDIAFESSKIHILDDIKLGSREMRLFHYVLGEGFSLGLGPSQASHRSSTSQLHSSTGDDDRNPEATFLHLAASIADVPLAYENIRLALTEISKIHRDIIAGSPRSSRTVALLKRLRHVAEILLEQHADISPVHHIDVDGHSPAYWAWHSLDLESIDLFITHGASDIGPFPPEPATTPSEASAPLWHFNPRTVADLRRRVALLSMYGHRPRPPRQCPCLSGKPLSECHGLRSHPYPSRFPCPCGSTKMYAKCCVRQAFKIQERWDEEQGRMAVIRCNDRSGITMNPLAPWLQRAPADALGSFIEGRLKFMDYMEKLDDALPDGHADKADPAYRYASIKFPGLLAPLSRLIPKNNGHIMSGAWNGIVDGYIALGTDSRRPLEIEQAAKLDDDFTPLWNRCEASGCDAVEQPWRKMKCCSGCKLIYYCSATCQRAHWKEHRTDCKTRTHAPQMLRSQARYLKAHTDIFEPAYAKILSGEPLDANTAMVKGVLDDTIT